MNSVLEKKLRKRKENLKKFRILHSSLATTKIKEPSEQV